MGRPGRRRELAGCSKNDEATSCSDPWRNDGLFVLRSPFASYGPVVRRTGSQLWIRTPRLLQALALGSYRREVHVDGDARFVFIDERRLWFFTKKTTVPFKQIQQISYRYRAWPTAWSVLGRIHDEVERFEITLKLEGTLVPVVVASYWGEGAAGGLDTWLMDDDLIDVEGTQADDSRELVRHLTALLPVDPTPKLSSIA